MFTRSHGEIEPGVYDRFAGVTISRRSGASDGELKVSSSLLCTAPPTHIYQPAFVSSVFAMHWHESHISTPLE
jgi:hypothetical protein